MDLEECYRKNIIKKSSKDMPRIRSLIETSDSKIKTVEMLEVNEITASSVVVLAYDALRELLEAAALFNGLKIYNHECFVPFIKNILNNPVFSDEFDILRKIRNGINYYGEKVTAKEAKSLKQRIISGRKLLIEKYLKIY